MTFETFDQSDEGTLHDQKKDNDKDNDNDNDNYKDHSERLVTSETLITCLTIENNNMNN